MAYTYIRWFISHVPRLGIQGSLSDGINLQTCVKPDVGVVRASSRSREFHIRENLFLLVRQARFDSIDIPLSWERDRMACAACRNIAFSDASRVSDGEPLPFDGVVGLSSYLYI